MYDEVEVEEGEEEGEEEVEEEGVGDDEDDEGEGSDEGKDGNEVEADEGSADASSRASPEPEPTVAKLRGPASKRAPQAEKASTTTTNAAARPTRGSTRGSTRAETEDQTKKGPPARPVKPVKQTYVNRKRPTRRAGAEFDDEGDDMDELALQGDETDYDEDAVVKEVRREEPESEADSGTESGSESDEEPELATPPSAKVLKELNDDLKSQRFPSLLLSSGIKLKIGDPIELTSGEKEPWLGKVVQIRTLKSGLTKVLNEKGDPLKNSRGKPALQSKESYVQIHWLYTKKMFESDVQDKSRITKTINSLGDYERVETSHADWYSQSKIKSIDEAVVVYRFDDTFPAQNPDHPDQQTDHALTQFRKPTLDDNLPLFFFGDEGPGSDQTPYVRTDFDFDPDVGEVEEAEKVAVEPVQKGKGRKRTASTSASASKANKKARLPRGPPLTLKLHSITCKPYNPRNVQIFSAEGHGGWYDVDDLIAYGKVAPLSRSVGLARLDQEVFSDDDNDDDENEDEDQAEGSHGRIPPPNKKGREVVRKMKHFKLPSLPTPERPKRGAKPAIDQDAAMLKWILGRGPMMRGGAYGLIGNSVILHRAQVLIDRFEKIPLNGPKLWQQDAHKVIVAFDEWDRCVQIRSKVKGKPWARLGLPPQGMCWTSPVSETHLV